MMDKIPANSNTNFNNALTGIFDKTELSDKFFSRSNLNLIQNKLKEGVYLKSKNKLRIDNQPEEIIFTVMRSYFLEYSRNLNTNINEQIHFLNNLVLNYLIKKLL